MATLGAAVRDGPAASAARRQGIAAPSPDVHGERIRRPATPRGIGHLSRLLVVGFALIGVATLGLLQVLQTSQVATTGFELRTLQIERTRLESETRLLEAGIAERSQLERVLDEAVTRLGMVEPEQTLRLSVTEPAPNTVPLPRRYIEQAPAIEQEEAAWWEPLLERLPGFD